MDPEIIVTGPVVKYYECSLTSSVDDLIVSWDDVFSGDSSMFNSTSISFVEARNNDTGVFEVTVTVESKYVVAATYDEFSSDYTSVTQNGYLGVTYVLDTNPFGSYGRLLQDGNTCENRINSSYHNESFLSSFWDYTLFPSDNSLLGNDDYLSYGDQNRWNLKLIDDECGNIQWTSMFLFNDLIDVCKDSNGDSSYELIESDSSDTIEFLTTFYLILVSPNPLYLTSCDGGYTDCGRYLTKTLFSHPLSIVFSKQKSIISNRDNVLIDLFTSNIISAEFVDSEDSNGDTTISYFKLTLITTVPNFMSLNIDTAAILSPTLNDLKLNNGGIDFISDYYILEEDEIYDSGIGGNCLMETEYRCIQQFAIMIELSQCPQDGGGLTFDGNYYLSADFDCISEDTSICDEYLSDEPLSVTLDSVDLSYSESCDSTVYEIDWDGEIIFYNDNTFNETRSSANDNTLTFEFGDTVYVKISVENDVSNYGVFGMSIVQCYLCTSDVNESNFNSFELSSCLDTSSVDQGLMYIIPDDTDLDYVLIDSDTSDEFEQFSFTLPTLADNVFYLDCTVELQVENNERRRRTRSRSLSQTTTITTNGNVFESFVGYAYATDNGNSSGGSDDKLFSIHLIVGIVCGIIVVLLIAGGIFLKYKIQDGKEAEIIATSTVTSHNTASNTV